MCGKNKKTMETYVTFSPWNFFELKILKGKITYFPNKIGKLIKMKLLEKKLQKSKEQKLSKHFYEKNLKSR